MPKTTTTCPGCRGSLELVPHPAKPGRLVGYCECNQNRAVLEVDAPRVEKPRRRKSRPPEEFMPDEPHPQTPDEEAPA